MMRVLTIAENTERVGRVMELPICEGSARIDWVGVDSLSNALHELDSARFDAVLLDLHSYVYDQNGIFGALRTRDIPVLGLVERDGEIKPGLRETDLDDILILENLTADTLARGIRLAKLRGKPLEPGERKAALLAAMLSAVNQLLDEKPMGETLSDLLDQMVEAAHLVGAGIVQQEHCLVLRPANWRLARAITEVCQADAPIWLALLRERKPVSAAALHSSQTEVQNAPADTLYLTPIFAGGELWGALVVATPVQSPPWTAEERDALQAFARALGAAVNRLQLTDSLREYHERYEVISSLISDVAFSLLPAERLEDWSFDWATEAFRRITGHSLANLQTLEAFWNVVAPEDQPLARDLFQRVKDGHSASAEYRIRTRNGAVRWLRMALHPVADEAGLLLRARGTAQDITERKGTEAALVNSEMHFRLLADNAPDVIYRYRLAPERGYEYISPAVMALVGKPPEEFYANPQMWTLITAPEDRILQENLLENLTDQESTESSLLVVRWLHARGYKVWVEQRIAPLYNARGELSAIESVGRDISDRKRDEKLREATYQVSMRANIAQSLDELYETVHREIGDLIPAENLLVALYDENTRQLSYPYYAGQTVDAEFDRFSLNSLIEYVVRVGEPVRLTAPQMEELVEQGELQMARPPALAWLGVPMRTADGDIIGALAVHSYHQGETYSLWDQEVLVFISTQVAMAVERKHAEEEMRASEARYRLMVHSLPVGVFRANIPGESAQTHFQMANPAFMKMLGTTHFEELSDISPATLFWEPDAWARLATDTLENGGMKGVELQIRGQNSVPIWVLATSQVINDSRGQPCYLEFVFQDITLHKRAVEALRESEELFRTLVVNADIGIVLAEIDGLIVFANEATSQIFHAPSDAWLLGQNLFRFVAETSLTDLWSDLEKLMREGGARTREYLLHVADGALIPVETTLSILTDAENHPNRVIMIIHDITQRKTREREREAIIAVSEALRLTLTRARTITVVINQVMVLLQPTSVGIALIDHAHGETYLEQAVGEMAPAVGARLPMDKGVLGLVLSTGNPYLNNSLNAAFPWSPGPVRAGACVPLMVNGQCSGALLVTSRSPIEHDEFGMLVAVADIAASGLHRATLSEETQRRLQRLTTLRAINLAINASLDLRVTLDVLLQQVTSHLHADAAAVLLLHPQAGQLQYTAWFGFNNRSMEQRRYRIGEGPPGRAVLERRIIHTALNPATSDGYASYFAVPLLVKGQLKGVLETYHRALVEPEEEWMDFLESLASQTAIAIDSAELFVKLQRSNDELALAYDATIEGWSHALDLRDQETEGHTRRVADLTVRLSKTMGIPDAQVVHIRRGALLHDIGKMAIPDSILLKPGPLTEEEWVVMRRHPEYAYQLLSQIVFLKSALEVPYCHHERWDGSGYPRGLRKEEIPLGARIFAVVDVWDALVSNRPYRAAWPETQVLEYIRNQAGIQFDPQVVEVFLRFMQSH